MKICLAEVTNRFDPKRNHGFYAKINGEGEQDKFIHGTSPYMGGAGGGFVGHIPGVGVSILVVQPEKGGDWYYLSSTFQQELSMTNEGVNSFSELPPAQRVVDVAGELGAGTGVPNILAYQDEDGNGIKFVRQKRARMSWEQQAQLDAGGNPQSFPDDDPSLVQPAMNIKTEIYSSAGKKVSLIDSPGIDSIILDAGNKTGTSKITITGDSADAVSQGIVADMVQVETTGPQKYINTDNQTDIVVGTGGRELQILNNAAVIAGQNATVEWGEESGLLCGNVNIQSKWKDVNTLSLAQNGRIFIECLDPSGIANGQRIEIQTHGTNGNIIIKTTGTVGIEAVNNLDGGGGDINIKAANNINMKAGNEVKIQSGNKISLNCPGGVVAADADGGTIELQGGKSSTTNPAVNPVGNSYGSRGITTY